MQVLEHGGQAEILHPDQAVGVLDVDAAQRQGLGVLHHAPELAHGQAVVAPHREPQPAPGPGLEAGRAEALELGAGGAAAVGAHVDVGLARADLDGAQGLELDRAEARELARGGRGSAAQPHRDAHESLRRRGACIHGGRTLGQRAAGPEPPSAAIGTRVASSFMERQIWTMPTYEYACPNCGIVEVFQSIKEKALTRCPQCKKRKVARMLSGGAGIIFKGSGFWETDYNRSDDYKKKSKEDAKDAKGAKGDPETKSKTQAQPKPSDPAPATTPSSNSGDAKPPPTKPSSPASP